MFMELYTKISGMYYELDEGEEMVHPLQISSLLVDWMDPQKTMYVRIAALSLLLFLANEKKM